MAEGSTPASLVNRALAEIAAQYTIAAGSVPPTFDGSTAGLAAGILYPPAITLLLRQSDWEFARTDVALVPATGVPSYPWSNVYIYPIECDKIRQVKPANWDPNDPQVIRWEEFLSAAGARVIGCNVPNAFLTFSTLNVTEAQFDTVFEETLVRYLASGLIMSLGGRPDFSTKLLEQAGGLVQQGVGLDS